MQKINSKLLLETLPKKNRCLLIKSFQFFALCVLIFLAFNFISLFYFACPFWLKESMCREIRLMYTRSKLFESDSLFTNALVWASFVNSIQLRQANDPIIVWTVKKLQYHKKKTSQMNYFNQFIYFLQNRHVDEVFHAGWTIRSHFYLMD